MTGSRGLLTVCSGSPLAREFPMQVVGTYLNVGDYGVCAYGVRVRLGESLGYGVKVCEFLISFPLE
jgi:hypothetical protein